MGPGFLGGPWGWTRHPQFSPPLYQQLLPQLDVGVKFQLSCCQGLSSGCPMGSPGPLMCPHASSHPPPHWGGLRTGVPGEGFLGMLRSSQGHFRGPWVGVRNGAGPGGSQS